MRVLDILASVDPLGASRFLGDNQLDAFMDHIHNLRDTTGTNNTVVAGSATGASKNGVATNYGASQTNSQLETSGAAVDFSGSLGTPSTSTETRMANMSIKLGITY